MPKAAQTNARWTTGLGLPALLGGLLMVGCQGSIERLDHQVAEMIAERQRLSLGEEGVSDASVGLPKQPSGSGLYDEQPVTTNPAADLLPAKPAP
ncbi:MAG: hypothetical protein AAF711_09355, partial [Planctomycetota bacterium]